MKRIVIAGAESTGKTTLAEALAGYYGEPWTGEFVRQYVDGLDRPLERGDLEAIARGQLAQEDFALDKAERFIIHDTNLLSSILYAKHYFDAEIDWVNDQFLARDYSLYLLWPARHPLGGRTGPTGEPGHPGALPTGSSKTASTAWSCPTSASEGTTRTG